MSESEIRHWHGYTLVCELCDYAESSEVEPFSVRLSEIARFAKREHDRSPKHRENVRRAGTKEGGE